MCKTCGIYDNEDVCKSYHESKTKEELFEVAMEMNRDYNLNIPKKKLLEISMAWFNKRARTPIILYFEGRNDATLNAMEIGQRRMRMNLQCGFFRNWFYKNTRNMKDEEVEWFLKM